MLINSVQSREFLRAEAFKPVVDKKGDPVPGKETFKRLFLRSQHHVSAKIGDRINIGSSSVFYGLEFCSTRNDPTKLLTIDDRVPAVASQSLTTLISVLRDLGIKQSVSGPGDYESPFDMRSLAYVCLYVAAATSCDVEPLLTTRARVAAVSANSSLHLGTTCTFSTGVFQNRDELMTLTYLAGAAGVNTMRVSTQTVPMVGSKLTGRALGAYALRVYANILAEAHTVAASAIHAEAAFSGALAFLKVLGHSSEGSGIRLAMCSRTYGPAVGFVMTHATSFCGLSTLRRLHCSDLTRYIISFVLTGVGRIARSDPTKSPYGLPTIYRPEIVTGRPDSMVGFMYDFYEMTNNWRKLAAEEDGLAVDDHMDGISCSRYFDENKVDNHFKNEAIIPFFYVEPGPISTSLKSNIFMLGCQQQGVTLPLFEKATGYKTLAYTEYHKIPVPGSVVRIVCNEGYQARRNGINYLFSGRYSKHNGLSQFNQVAFPGSGIYHKDMAMSGDANSHLANRRWHTYHCPLPNPGENFTVRPTCFSYTYAGGRVEPTLSELVDVKVDSVFGTLVIAEAGQMKNSYHRTIPDHLVDVVGQTAGVFPFLEEKANMVDYGSAIGQEGGMVSPNLPSTSDLIETVHMTGPTEVFGIEEHKDESIEAVDDPDETFTLPPGSGELQPAKKDEAPGGDD
jgi:hypothetical protein